MAIYTDLTLNTIYIKNITSNPPYIFNSISDQAGLIIPDYKDLIINNQSYDSDNKILTLTIIPDPSITLAYNYNLPADRGIGVIWLTVDSFPFFSPNTSITNYDTTTNIITISQPNISPNYNSILPGLTYTAIFIMS